MHTPQWGKQPEEGDEEEEMLICAVVMRQRQHDVAPTRQQIQSRIPSRRRKISVRFADLYSSLTHEKYFPAEDGNQPEINKL